MLGIISAIMLPPALLRPVPLLLPALLRVRMLGQYAACLRERQPRRLCAAGKLGPCSARFRNADLWSRLQVEQRRFREQHAQMRPLNTASRHWQLRPWAHLEPPKTAKQHVLIPDLPRKSGGSGTGRPRAVSMAAC